MSELHTQVDPEVKAAAVKVCSTWLCVLAGWGLADVTAVLGLVSVILAILYTSLNLYVLWRDKLRSNRDEGRQGKDDAAASP